jgi:hypothetical protein
MMFQVVWVEASLDELAEIWTRADSTVRHAITVAADAVDRELSTNPYSKGESREDQERIFFVHPLGIEFSIDAQHSIIRVQRVWNIRRKH